MSDKSTEYSLDTPIFSNQNILNHKIASLFGNNIMSGGDENNNTSGFGYPNLLIGIIVIIIGFVLLFYKNDLVESEALILNSSCNDNKNKNECKINIIYSVNSTKYSKILDVNKNDIPNNPIIKIYYQQSNPNSVQLTNPDYSIVGISMIIIGSFVACFSIFNYNSSGADNKS